MTTRDYYQLELDDLVISLSNADATIERLKKQLKIATKALSDIEDGYSESTCAGQTVRQALKEMEGVK